MKTPSKLLRIVLPLVILLVGAAAMVLLIVIRPEPRKEVRESPGALVETIAVVSGDRQVEVHGTGTVQARQEITLTPQVSGRVVEVAPGFVAGGLFRKGDLLFRIEEADYRLAVDRARAALARADYDLATVEGQARVARQEWERLKLGSDAEPNPLVLYEPQLKNAQAARLSARAALQQAELDLERTELRAPFNAILRSESVDLGQYVRSGTSVALLSGTDQAEIVVPLTLPDLAWVDVPRRGGNGSGSKATVLLGSAEDSFRWQGRVVRALGEVDPQGRMARLVVAVEDPYGLKDSGNRPDLAVGSFVQVILHGRTLQNVAVLPSVALRDGGTVWVMNDSQLHIRPVEVLRRAREEVVIGTGLESGERVVLTPLAGAAEGMKLRPVGEEPGDDAKASGEAPR